MTFRGPDFTRKFPFQELEKPTKLIETKNYFAVLLILRARSHGSSWEENTLRVLMPKSTMALVHPHMRDKSQIVLFSLYFAVCSCNSFGMLNK